MRGGAGGRGVSINKDSLEVYDRCLSPKSLTQLQKIDSFQLQLSHCDPPFALRKHDCGGYFRVGGDINDPQQQCRQSFHPLSRKDTPT